MISPFYCLPAVKVKLIPNSYHLSPSERFLQTFDGSHSRNNTKQKSVIFVAVFESVSTKY
jgi:hypothetical protein